MLRVLGLKRNLPVFITETGWAHREGVIPDSNYLAAEQVAQYFELAANTVWTDKNIVAITPFLLNYQSFPFANFSWQKPALSADVPSSPNFYPQFDTYRSLPKIAGNPLREINSTPTLIPLSRPILGVETASSNSLWQTVLSLFVNLRRLVYNRN
jgi:hypothetical protein